MLQVATLPGVPLTQLGEVVFGNQYVVHGGFLSWCWLWDGIGDAPRRGSSQGGHRSVMLVGAGMTAVSARRRRRRHDGVSAAATRVAERGDRGRDVVGLVRHVRRTSFRVRTHHVPPLGPAATRFRDDAPARLRTCDHQRMSTRSNGADGRRWLVRIRQWTDRLRHRLSFVPGLYVLGSIVLVSVLLRIDRDLDDRSLPDVLTTNAASARSLFAAIAGGLITSITLLLSLMLVTIQLASSQFSPRSLRDWLGSSHIQNTIGLALGTAVFCLLGLRSTGIVGDQEGQVVPNITVLAAVILGVAALFAVVRSVDQLTDSLRIGAVAQRIADDTTTVVRRSDEIRTGEAPAIAPARPAPPAAGSDDDRSSSTAAGAWEVPPDASPVTTATAGWVQQVDVPTLLAALPDGVTGHVAVPLGSFAAAGSPLLWLTPATDDDDVAAALREGFALGDTRTMQQDVGFGLVQLTDIAVRALSPGVNDPGTAEDIVVQLGDVLLSIWERPLASSVISEDDRCLVNPPVRHEDHLHRAIDPVRRYGRADPIVVSTIVRTMLMLRAETTRRGLPGPVAPIDDMIEATATTADHTAWSARERSEIERLREVARRTREDPGNQ